MNTIENKHLVNNLPGRGDFLSPPFRGGLGGAEIGIYFWANLILYHKIILDDLLLAGRVYGVFFQVAVFKPGVF